MPARACNIFPASAGVFLCKYDDFVARKNLPRRRGGVSSSLSLSVSDISSSPQAQDSKRLTASLLTYSSEPAISDKSCLRFAREYRK